MAIRRMDHIGIVVDDLAAATAFFAQIGLEPSGNGSVEGALVDRIVGSRAFDRTSPSCGPRTATRSSS